MIKFSLSTRPFRPRQLVLWFALYGWLGCSGEGGTGLEVPSLRVRAATSGVEQDPDGYAVAVDGGAGRPLGLNATIEIGSLADGPHTVELLEVAPNCAVQGTHPRTVQTASGNTADVSFDIECQPSTGAVRVITTTSGQDQDEDGYVVLVNGDARQIDLNASVTFEGVTTGEAVAEILGVAANCSAATETYYPITVIGGGRVDVTFAFDCSTRQPDTGTLQVATATTGPSTDPDGYSLSVDGGAPTPIPATGSTLLSGLAAGTRAVALSGVAANCAVNGANPRGVTVTGTEVAALTFSIVCTSLPPTTGTLRVTTTTGGSDSDPDGYTVTVDGGAVQPIGINATISIASLSSGSHTVSLGGMAANCIAADNPRTVTVPTGGTAQVTYAVSCVPAFGTITTTTVTTGTSLDPDGYVARVNGGAGKEIPANGTVTRGGLAPGTHTVQLDNVASNCQVQGENPRTVAVSGNATTAVTFSVTCAATTGTLVVTVAGLPPTAAAAITVTGPDNYSTSITGTVTLVNLTPGQYTVNAADVTVAADTFRPSSGQQDVTVSGGESPSLTVTYSRGSGQSINLRIESMYLTQGSQRPDGSVALVAGRDAYLRVFVVANGENSTAPKARIRVYQSGTLVSTLQIIAPTGSTPTVAQESPLGTSWNVRVQGAFIQPGLAVLADVDPDGEVAETDETDNIFPLEGVPAATVVRRASEFAVRLVPVQVGNSGTTGDVSSATFSQFLDPTLRMFPLPGINADLHAVFTSSRGPLDPNDANGAWHTALSELDALRVVEGSTRTYYGVVRIGYSSGIGGLGYVGRPTAIGYDALPDAGRVAAHEFGHTWNRRHAPCGNPGGPDPNYPYVGGAIGVSGFNLDLEALVEPSRPDIMGYCGNPWISDYTYLAVMAFRESFQPPAAAMRAMPHRAQASLLLWGRIENGRPVLEPAFIVDAPPSLPTEPGPYRLEGLAIGGGRLFSLSFDATPVADGRQDANHFAFAVPISPSAASELSQLRLDGPTGAAEVSATATTQARLSSPAQVQRIGGRVEVRWDATSEPMAMVRDASTGEVLAFARGGRVEIPTTAAQLEVHVSDQIRSRRLIVPVTP